MSWFERHLNWTYILAILVASIINLVLILIMVSAENHKLDWLLFVDYPIALLAFVGVAAWVIKQKGRSLFNLFWLLLGWIGTIIILCLENKRRVKPSEEVAQDNLRKAAWLEPKR